MFTEYVTFIRPTVAAIKMTKGPFIFKAFLGSWNFKSLAENKTEVRFLYSFALRSPFSLFGNIIRRNLQRNVQQRLKDLKKSIEGL